MRFFAVLSLALTITQAARLTHQETLEASELLQSFEKLAEHQRAKLETKAKAKAQAKTKVDTAALTQLSARLDALEDAHWNLFGKVRNWVASNPHVAEAMENPIV